VNAKRRHDRKSDPISYKMKIMLNCARQRAKEECVPFDLTFEWLLETFGHLTHCPVLGIKLDWKKDTGGPSRNSPTIDKLVGAHGYTKGNVALISHKANAMKNDATPDELLLFCHHHIQRLGDQCRPT